MNKIRSTFVGVLVALMANASFAEGVMNLITLNTNDPAGYAAWAKKSAAKLVEANDSMAMGLCSPTSGAQVIGDHYLWTFFESQEKAWSSDPNNPVVRAEVAKLDVDRTIRTWDNWRIVRPAAVTESGYYYNMYVETDDVAGYLADLEGMIAEMDKRDYGVTMQVFVGDTGETVGTVMISLGAADGATLGRALDARTESWFTDVVAGFSAQRQIVHGFSMTCETYAMAG